VTKQKEFTESDASLTRRAVHKVRAMQDKQEIDQRVSVAELIAWVSEVQDKIEVHGKVNDSNLLLRDFARELLKKRLRVMKVIRP